MIHANTTEWQCRCADRVAEAAAAVRKVHAGDRVFVGSCAGEPRTLVEALAAREDLTDTEIVHLLTFGDTPGTAPQYWSRFRHNAFFIGSNVRSAIADGRADYTPICLSEIPDLFRSDQVPIDVALISVSPPDRHGYCSLGVSCDITKAAAQSARIVIAEVNDQMPRTLGNCIVRVEELDVLVPTDRPVVAAPPHVPSECQQRIAKKVASLIDDGATLQIGIGTIPNTVLGYLTARKDLGVHTEMFSDGLIPLIESGVVTNDRKTRHRGKVVTSFVMGSQKLYDFVDDNPAIEFQPTEYVNDPFLIAQLDNMVAINSALEVDLTGQVCSDSIGTLLYSGVGSQVDFARGAARSRGGKPIIAIPSTAKNETVSRIVPCLRQGAGVVTSRSDIRYVVTEYGIAYLHGKSIRERAMALIEVAHPKFRPWLLSEAKARNFVYADQVEPPVHTPVYPDAMERWVELKDGSRVFMRPLKLADEPLMRDMFYRLSPESVRSRFFRMLSAMPHEKLQDFLRIDYSDEMAFVVLSDRTRAARMIGFAHYSKDPATRFADAAFLVRDDWHGKGMGKALMKALTETARQHGILGMTADVLLDNAGMLRVFHQCGFPIESTLEDGVYSLRIPFGASPTPRDHVAQPIKNAV